MNTIFARQTLRAVGLVLLLALFMSVEWLRQVEFANSLAASLPRAMASLVLSESDRVLVLSALTVYLLTLFWMATSSRRGARGRRWPFGIRVTPFDALRLALASWALLAYALDPKAGDGNIADLRLGIDQTTNVFVLLTGLATSYAVELCLGDDAASGCAARRAVLSLLTFILAGASALHAPIPHVYKYHGAFRWTGLWVNPNTYGLLMGTGCLLAIGNLAATTQGARAGGASTVRSWLKRAAFALALALCAMGLARSYSRGAWLATACALVLIGINAVKRASRFEAWAAIVRRNWCALALGSLSILCFAFWHFRFAHRPLASRLVSVGNINDFSWRNRVTAWGGETRMLADRPLLGFGWSRVEAAYAKSYRAPRLEETMAIQLNDFFTLALSAGIPSALFFCACVALGLFRRIKRPTASDQSLETDSLSATEFPQNEFWDGTTCRAVCALSLIGFWFDGGLFRLATGPLFWALLGLARLDADWTAPTSSIGRPDSGPRSRREIAVCWLAICLAVLASSETAIHLALPRLKINQRTLRLARNHLVAPGDRREFDVLAAKPFWRDKNVGILVDHVELADYNRILISWKIGEREFEDFVLSPQVDPAADGRMDWRRPLWEYFYPRVRRAPDAETAAETIAQLLGRQVTTSSRVKSASITVMWNQKSASIAGFQSLLTAALRSAGIPARLNSRKEAEFFFQGVWRRAQ